MRRCDYRFTVGAVGGATDPPNDDARRTAHKPHWWAVLAVTLALMALVAAVSSTTRRAPSLATSHGTSAHRVRSPNVSVNSTTVPSDAITPAGTAGTASSIGATQEVARATPSNGDPTGAGGSAATTAPVTPTSAPSSTVPTPATGTVPPATTTPPTVAASANGTDTFPGNLEYPENISAQYPVTTGGGVTATADWSGASDLTLAVACPGDQGSRNGPSGLSVSVGGSAGTCTVTLSEPSSVQATVSYSLTVQYQGS